MKGPSLPAPRFQTLQAMLAAAAESDSGLTFRDSTECDSFFPWRELYRRARHVAAGLAELGVSPGDRVALVLPTCPGFVDAFFGTLLAGAIPVPLYPPLRLGRLKEYHASTARMIQVVGARLVITEARVRQLLGLALSQSRPALGCRSINDLSLGFRKLARHGQPDEIAVIQFSSGSTVDPKPVALTHCSLLTQCAVLNFLVNASGPPPHSGVSWLPLYHDMGLIGSLLNAAYYPGHVVLLPPENFLARPSLWLRAISEHRATMSGAPNFAYGLCVKRIRDQEMEGVDLSSWRVATNGAEPISMRVMRQFAARFGRWGFNPRAFTPGYGLAEAALAVSYARPTDPVRVVSVDSAALARSGQALPGSYEIVSVGAPVPGGEVEIRDEQGAVLLERRLGRIFVRGPSIMAGYFGKSAATAEAIVDGWLDTGDLGFFVEGELYVAGRAKDVVIIRGANHAPQEFESCLDDVEGARVGCAVALGFSPQDAESEELLILAERTPNAPADLEERIRTTVLERTGIRPHTVRVLEPGTLPRTSSGKLRRREALRQFLSGELAPPVRVTALRMAWEVARSSVAFAKVGLSRDR